VGATVAGRRAGGSKQVVSRVVGAAIGDDIFRTGKAHCAGEVNKDTGALAVSPAGAASRMECCTLYAGASRLSD
jgi:hypothetical protein